MRTFLKKIVFGYRASSIEYINKLRELGATIGDDVTIHAPRSATIDLSSPYLLSIGSHVNIAGPATILTHDYSWSVIKGKWGDVLGNEKPVKIGNNVFIGWGATILCGTTIEDDVIIGAHSVVSGRVYSGSVYGGVPARRICSLEEYRSKRDEAQQQEAFELYRSYTEHFNREPPEEVFREYFPLFCDPSALGDSFMMQAQLMGNYDLSVCRMRGARKFASYNDFLKACRKQVHK